jgi:hypothetical protein
MEEITINAENSVILSNSLNTIDQNLEIFNENVDLQSNQSKNGFHIRCLTCKQIIYINLKQIINSRIEEIDFRNFDVNTFKFNPENLFKILFDFEDFNYDNYDSFRNANVNVNSNASVNSNVNTYVTTNSDLNQYSNSNINSNYKKRDLKMDMFSIQLCCNCKHYLNKFL